MTDIPGQQPGGCPTRTYEIQILTPNLHREGERWRPLGEPYGELAKAEYAISDLVRSIAQALGEEDAQAWRRLRLRVMEKVTTCVYGKQMSMTDTS